MVRIVQQRIKCIGCNACVEAAAHRWRMSRKDGKSTLVGGEEKQGFYTVLVGDEEYAENVRAATHCPVKIIKVEKV
jgi:ferredoxin